MRVHPEEPSRPPIDPARVDVPAGWRLDLHDELGSTNAEASAQARTGAGEGLVVVAEHQTAGRGRSDRRWQTPPRAGLTVSVLLRPQVPEVAWPWLALLGGLAVVETVDAVDGPPTLLKWPNDVLHEGAKLAGLLAELVDTASGPAVVLGVGLNVTTRRDELPVETATSLLLAGYPALERADLLSALLAVLADRYARWQRAGGGSGTLHAAYTARCDTIGRRVRVHLPAGREVVGTVTGIGQDGGLELTSSNGPVRVSAGDVVHLRPV